MSDEDQRPFTIMMAFRQTARLMIDELIERLEADGHEGVHPPTTRCTRTSIRRARASPSWRLGPP